MIYTILSIVILAIEALVFGIFIAKVISRKAKNKAISVNDVFFFVSSFFILFALYALGISYCATELNEEVNVFHFINAINYSLSIFRAKVETDYMSVLIASEPLYYIAFIVASLMALASVFVTAFGVVKHFIINSISVKKYLKQGCDILIGNSQENFGYVKTYKKTLLWVDYPLDKNAKKSLREKGVCYFTGEFSKDELVKRLGNAVNTEVEFHLIALDGKDDNLKYISEFKRFIDETSSQNVYLYAKLDYENFITINNKILAEVKYAPYINCFNKYELIARKFVESYPITKYLPKDFFDYDLSCIKDGVNLNVFYFGFGKVSTALHRAQVMNDQLPTVKGAKQGGDLKHCLVNYYAYDVVEKKNENKNFNYYDNRFYSEYAKYTPDKYFEVPSKICNFSFSPTSIDHLDGFNNFKTTALSDKNTFNTVIVSYGEDVDNIDYAMKTAMLFKQNDFDNYHIFVRVKKYQKEYEQFFDGKATFFGYDDFVINHKVIVDENLTAKAKSVNANYQQKTKEMSKWAKLSAIKKTSNIYSGLNARLKLNLLGYDLEENDGTNYSESVMTELKTKLKENAPTEQSTYADYFFFDKDIISPANVLAYQEKLRWNAFYINNGYAPMPKSDIFYNKDSGLYKDDDDKKLHACITTDRGLDEYHRLIAKLKSEQTGEPFTQCLEDLQTYKYDYSFSGVVETFTKDKDLVVVKKQ